MSYINIQNINYPSYDSMNYRKKENGQYSTEPNPNISS